MRDLVLGVDCSTTAAKAIVWDGRGTAVSEGRAGFELLSPRPGWYEQRASDWWSATTTALREACSRVDASRIAALAIAHQRETFVALREDRGTGAGTGEPLEALRDGIVWMDERAVPLVDRFADGFGRERLHRITGKPPCVTPSLFKIAWLAENEPELLARSRIAEVHAYLVLGLTGAFRTGTAAADPTGLVDVARGDWSDDVLAAVGLDRSRVPELVRTGALVGTVRREAAAKAGLPEGLPVFAGGGDGQVAALGAGISGPGRAYVNLGTAVVMGVVSDSYVVDGAFRTMAGAGEATFVLESDLKGGTFTIDWLLRRFAPGASVRELDEEAARLPAGAEGLVVVPYWAGVMNPYWDDSATGIAVGWHGGHGRAHLHRAILEGIAMEQRLALEGIERATVSPVEELVVLGGGAKSDLWCRILADATARRVVRSRATEATCLGSGILAAVGVGLHADLRGAVAAMTASAETFEPGPESEAYGRIYGDVYRGLYPGLRQPLDRLATLRRRH